MSPSGRASSPSPKRACPRSRSSTSPRTLPGPLRRVASKVTASDAAVGASSTPPVTPTSTTAGLARKSAIPCRSPSSAASPGRVPAGRDRRPGHLDLDGRRGPSHGGQERSRRLDRLGDDVRRPSPLLGEPDPLHDDARGAHLRHPVDVHVAGKGLRQRRRQDPGRAVLVGQDEIAHHGHREQRQQRAGREARGDPMPPDPPPERAHASETVRPGAVISRSSGEYTWAGRGPADDRHGRKTAKWIGEAPRARRPTRRSPRASVPPRSRRARAGRRRRTAQNSLGYSARWGSSRPVLPREPRASAETWRRMSAWAGVRARVHRSTLRSV